MLDEFYSIGMIPSFTTFIATCRKRKLYITMILQGIGQLFDLYGENGGNTIQTCASCLIFLGCNDPQTAKFISEFVSGEATVLDESHRDDAVSAGSSFRVGDISVATAKRNVLTVDESRRYTKHVLIAKRGEHALELTPFPYTDHPAYLKGELKPVSIYSEITPLAERGGGILDTFSSQSEIKKHQKIVGQKINSITPLLDAGNTEAQSETESEKNQTADNKRKKQGRKRMPDAEQMSLLPNMPAPVKRKRGRPKKVSADDLIVVSEDNSSSILKL